jgi:uncharacterized protein YbjT (DUF2867 family)
MILVTGGTGFIGRVLIRQLVQAGYPVRTLVRPSPRTPRLPRGVPVEVAVVSLADERGLRAALRDVEAVFHLAGGEGQGGQANLMVTDIRGTDNLARAAQDAGVQRMLYVSHLHADRASAFPVLKAKGIAEEYIRRSGVPYTIFRTSIIFGPEDHFTTSLARYLRLSPGIFPLPGDGRTTVQPLWVEDLVTCMLWSLQDSGSLHQTYEIGGSEYFTLRQVAETLLSTMHLRRLLVSMPAPLMRATMVVLEATIPKFPFSSFWLDYFAVSRTCPLDNLPRYFGLMPARFTYRLDYLARSPWYTSIFHRLRGAVPEGGQRLSEGLRTWRVPHSNDPHHTK